MSPAMNTKALTQDFQRRIVSSILDVRSVNCRFVFIIDKSNLVFYGLFSLAVALCGSPRTVAPIKAGFQARVGRRNAGT
ncbi:hypothetical protein PanWU01x14_063330 [Parasponia andersonii]|uniref:Uncharacterized protein n=1 Tax=Parasponia andersonii TaxID=3476 RepID=A0A2P5DHT1_PARAD|nr:hypothetical protein PanWU01x14_063330 [Parasponia andersonii]